MSQRKRRRAAAQAQQRAFKRGRVAALRFKGRKANGTLQETKFHDLDIDDAIIAVGGTIAQVSCLTIAQGTTESTRIGRKIIVRHIGWKFNMVLPSSASAGATSDTVRVILYQDKQTNGATATVTGILETNDYQSFNQLANKSRFRTLMDRTYSLNSAPSGDGTTTNTGEHRIHASLFKKLDIAIEYDNSFTTGVIGTMRSNNIGVLLLSHSGFVVFESKMRVRFSDG